MQKHPANEPDSALHIGVFSDSHGMRGQLSTLLMKMEAITPVQAIFHLGDGAEDLNSLNVPLPPVWQVAGNCDLFRQDVLKIAEPCGVGGVRFLLTHGHLQRVKQELDQLTSLALQQNASVALFGHTHVPYMARRDGILLLNPGAACNGRFAILTVTPDSHVTAVLY